VNKFCIIHTEGIFDESVIKEKWVTSIFDREYRAKIEVTQFFTRFFPENMNNAGKYFKYFCILTVSLALFGCAERKEISEVPDILLIYNSEKIQTSDVNFRKISEYYGLLCGKIDLSGTAIAENLFGNITTAGINSTNLEGLKPEELALLRDKINAEGMKLIVFMQKSADCKNLKKLTSDEVMGVSAAAQTGSYSVSDLFPLITREFAGQELRYPDTERIPCINVNKDAARTFPLIAPGAVKKSPAMFIYHKSEKGEIFFIAGKECPNLEKNQMYKIYYSTESFYNLLPAMMAIRYAMGNRCWHNERNYVNFTIDDPPLRQTTRLKDYMGMDYFGMLKELKKHNFHITIALIPDWMRATEKRVVDIFLKNPDRFSIVQHGNNHDGYEFWHYTSQPGDSHPPKPYSDQDEDLAEGMQRMNGFSKITGIPWGRLIIFPGGICPLKTFKLLKKYNFLCTINYQREPLGEKPSNTYDYQMYPAELSYGSFPLVTREFVNLPPFFYLPYYNLFIDKPTLNFFHTWDLTRGNGTFNSLVDKINKITQGVEWKSLGYIAEHLYLERERADGDIEVRMFSNGIVLENKYEAPKKYRICKRENFDVPVKCVRVDNAKVQYKRKEDYICVNIVINAHSEKKIRIEYKGPK